MSINTGSSSIKLKLFTVSESSPNPTEVMSASVSNIGYDNCVLKYQIGDHQTNEKALKVKTKSSAVTELLYWLNDKIPGGEIDAIGHRIVHGGPNYDKPQLITDEIEKGLESLAAIDPEHIPATLQLIDILKQHFPNAPQIACFDTSFFFDLPRVAQLIAIPKKYQSKGIKKYGFHGISYTYLLAKYQDLTGEELGNKKIILAHLGSGASLAAVSNGRPVDTSMSFTPASGIMMSSRSGDLDPGIVGYLHNQTGMSVDTFTRMVNFDSGLKGVSGLSEDMYTLLQNESTNSSAAEAVELFVYQVKKTIGSLSATLGGLDTLIFSGGIGEQSSIIRSRICDGLNYLGVSLDASKNDSNQFDISSQQSTVGIHVLQTDEALVIANEVYKIMRGNNES